MGICANWGNHLANQSGQDLGHCEVCAAFILGPRQSWIKFQRDRCIRIGTVITAKPWLGTRRNTSQYWLLWTQKILLPWRGGPQCHSKAPIPLDLKKINFMKKGWKQRDFGHAWEKYLNNWLKNNKIKEA